MRFGKIEKEMCDEGVIKEIVKFEVKKKKNVIYNFGRKIGREKWF